MLSAADLKGIMAMMPAFTTDDGGDIRVTDTIDIDRLHKGVNRILKDGGADVITTTGSFGEATNLLPNELETLAHETVSAVNKRVPVIVGCIGMHSRDVVQKVKIAEAAGADGVVLGVPGYFPSTAANALQYFKDVSELFPKLGILIYHNPVLHHVTLPVEMFSEIAKISNVVGMKDSHRTTMQFQRLMELVRGKISIFVNHTQYNVYKRLGAAGFWSIDVWMGPESMVALKKAVDSGDEEKARRIAIDTAFNHVAPVNMQWREIPNKLALHYAGYCEPGPLRPPFIHVPEDVVKREKDRAERWRALCEQYRT